ncbi:UNVERIFIED_CONTAM: hypothetical protein NCL1_44999 [Trichonephila clavipes]
MAFTKTILFTKRGIKERGEETHLELWLRFSEGIGIKRYFMQNQPLLSSTAKLVDVYFELAKTDYPAGVRALYAYERRTPDVAASKISGLKKTLWST